MLGRKVGTTVGLLVGGFVGAPVKRVTCQSPTDAGHSSGRLRKRLTGRDRSGARAVSVGAEIVVEGGQEIARYPGLEDELEGKELRTVATLEQRRL